MKNRYNNKVTQSIKIIAKMITLIVVSIIDLNSKYKVNM